MKKIKILMLCDHPLATSGVSTQSRWLISGLLNTNKYTFRVFGGAIKHENYDTVVVNPDFIIKPTDGFGNRELLRNVLATERPDVLLLFTDPRFFTWVWQMEEEIHQICPIAYNTLWDNPPYPQYNQVLYESTDLLNCINWPTYEMLKERFPEKTNYVPHAVPPENYRRLKSDEVAMHKRKILGPEKADDFIITFVSRNARRKMPSDIIMSFRQFLDEMEKKYGHQKASLVFHTDPLDPEGPNLLSVIDMLGLQKKVVFSKERIGFPEMNILYNISDVVVNRSCFAAGTKIATSEGYKNIEDVQVGDNVLTHMRRYRAVVQTIVNPPPGRAYRLRATGMDPITVTGNHRVFAIKKSDLPFGYLINENLEDFCKRATKIPISELSKGDYVRYASPKRETKTITYDMYEFNQNFNPASTFDRVMSHSDRYDHCKRFVKLDEDLAYVLGEFVGDGSTNSTSVSFNKNDQHKIDKYVQCIERCFEQRAIVLERKKHIDVSVQNGSVIKAFFNKFCGHYSHGKQIPDDVMNASNEIKRAFLNGYVAADGCYLQDKKLRTSPTWRCRTVSNKLVMQLRDLLIDLGVVPRIHLTDNSHGYNKKGKIWTIEWNDILDHGQKFNASCRSWTHDGISIARISALDEIEFNEPVYNLTVEEDHTYVSGGINCTNCNEGFGLSILEAKMAERPVIALKTGGMTRQVEDHETGEQYGIALDPEVRCLVGNQNVHYIYEDFVSHETVAKAMMTVYEMGEEKRNEIGARSRAHALKNYNMDNLIKSWDESLTKLIGEWKYNHRWKHIEL